MPPRPRSSHVRFVRGIARTVLTLSARSDALASPIDGSAGQSMAMVEMSREEFEGIVADALDAVPARFMQALDNVVFLVDDEPPADLQGCLGVYDGVPEAERLFWGETVLPSRITVFMNPTLRACETVDGVREEVLVTVLHELGHYHGIEEDRLHDLGWG